MLSQRKAAHPVALDSGAPARPSRASVRPDVPCGAHRCPRDSLGRLHLGKHRVGARHLPLRCTAPATTTSVSTAAVEAGPPPNLRLNEQQVFVAQAFLTWSGAVPGNNPSLLTAAAAGTSREAGALSPAADDEDPARGVLAAAQPTLTAEDELQLLAMLSNWVDSIEAADFGVDYSDIISCLWCLSERGLTPRPDFLTRALAALHPHTPHLTPHEAASLIVALHRLPPAPTPPALLPALLSATRPHLQHNTYPAYHLPTLLASLAALAARTPTPTLPRTWLDSFLLSATSALPALSSDDLYLLFTSLPPAPRPPSPEFLAAFEEAHLPHLHALSGSQLAALLHTAATLHAPLSNTYLSWLLSTLTYKAPSLAPADTLSLLSSLARLRVCPKPTTLQPLISTLTPHLPDLPPASLFTLVHTLHALRAQPPPAFLTALAAATLPDLPSLSATQLIALASFFATASHPPHDPWLPTLAALLHPHLHTLPAPQLAALTATLAHLGAAPADDFLTDLLAALHPHLPSLDADGLAAVLHAVACLGAPAYEAWMETFLAASAPRLKAMEPSQLVQCLAAAADLDADVDDGWMAHWSCAAFSRCGEFAIDEIEILLHALARVNVVVGGGGSSGPGGRGGGDGGAFQQQLLQQYVGCLTGGLAKAVQERGEAAEGEGEGEAEVEAEAELERLVACLEGLRERGCRAGWVESMLAQVGAW